MAVGAAVYWGVDHIFEVLVGMRSVRVTEDFSFLLFSFFSFIEDVPHKVRQTSGCYNESF